MKQMAMFAPQQSPVLPWVSAPVRIGKHDWWLVRVETIDMISSRTERYLNYQWSPAGQDDWRPSREWPRLRHQQRRHARLATKPRPASVRREPGDGGMV